MAYKQHVIDWCSGKGGTNRTDFKWTAVNSGGATGAMSDEVDGGFKMSTGSTNNARAFIGFNQKRQFSPTGSVMISVVKHGSLTGGESYVGLQDGSNSGVGKGAWTHVDNDYKGTYFSLHTVGAGGSIFVESGYTADTNWHTHKIELTSSQASLEIDGTTTTTSTVSSQLPAVALAPSVGINTTSSANRTLNIRYLECYNT